MNDVNFTKLLLNVLFIDADVDEIAKTILDNVEIDTETFYNNGNRTEDGYDYEDTWCWVEDFYLKEKIYPKYAEFENKMEWLVKFVLQRLSGTNKLNLPDEYEVKK